LALGGQWAVRLRLTVQNPLEPSLEFFHQRPAVLIVIGQSLLFVQLVCLTMFVMVIDLTVGAQDKGGLLRISTE
jgi:hypothetical protein